ncbi:MAG: hypothetical protein C0392_05750 [Syntrophus sp. (in: bacteria)]|nr:hypothetical protein [Syntrophus sp. (in: bacteria)]
MTHPDRYYRNCRYETPCRCSGSCNALCYFCRPCIKHCYQGGVESSPYVGDSAIEVEFLDGQTNEQVAAYVERRIGKKNNVDLSEGPENAAVKGAAEPIAPLREVWKPMVRENITGEGYEKHH